MTNEPKTLGEMDHTNPYTGRVFGETRTYSRGKRVAADGGKAEAGTDADDAGALSDVSHAPDDADGVQRSFDRGESR
jgi:hypothetical protein